MSHSFSLRSLLFASVIIGLNAAAFFSFHPFIPIVPFILIATVIGTSVLISIELMLSYGHSSQSAAKFCFYCCELHCVLLGFLGADFFMFFRRGEAMFGIGPRDPILSTILAAIEGLPISYVAYRLTWRIGDAIHQHRSREKPFHSV